MHLGLLPGWDGTDAPERSCIGCRRRAGEASLVTGRQEGLCRACAESAALDLASPQRVPAPDSVRCVFCAIRADPRRRFHLWPDGAICESCIGLSLQIFAGEGPPSERHWLT
jgi:hypothetical protein